MRRQATPAIRSGEGSHSLARDAYRTRERLMSMEGRNPLRARLQEGGDNTPWADSLEELHNDMNQNEFLATREILVGRLKTLSRAEEKRQEGTYGLCDGCGGAISSGRLRALPGATHCVRCAEQLERATEERRPLRKAEDQLAAA
jgi:RNA polymerase-binding transcription factor DksA